LEVEMLSFLLLLVACGQCKPQDREIEALVRQAWLAPPDRTGKTVLPPERSCEIEYEFLVPPRPIRPQMIRPQMGAHRIVEDGVADVAREVGRAQVLMAWVESTGDPRSPESQRFRERFLEVRRDFNEFFGTPRTRASNNEEYLRKVKAINIALIGVLKIQLAVRNETFPPALRELQDE
jgi:hypothetical protein